MLTIKSSGSSSRKCTPNIIPCRIHHSGPTKITKRYWAPSRDKDDSQTAYFRGRRLRGRAVKVPAGYQGMVLKTTTKILPHTVTQKVVRTYDDEDDMDDEEQDDLPEPVNILDRVAMFDEVLVWGHDQVPPCDDAFVRNIEEWITFAEAIHGKSYVSKSETDNNCKNETATATI